MKVDILCVDYLLAFRIDRIVSIFWLYNLGLSFNLFGDFSCFHWIKLNLRLQPYYIIISFNCFLLINTPLKDYKIPLIGVYVNVGTLSLPLACISASLISLVFSLFVYNCRNF